MKPPLTLGVVVLGLLSLSTGCSRSDPRSAQRERVEAAIGRLDFASETWKQTREEIKGLGKPAIPLLLNAVRSNPHRSRLEALADAMFEIDESAAIVGLKSLLRDSDMSVRSAGVSALGSAVNHEKVWGILLEAAQDPSVEVRVKAFFSLSRSVAHPPVLVALRKGLSDPSPLARIAAARSLARRGNAEGTGVLLESMGSPHEEIRVLAVDAAGFLKGSKVEQAVERALKDPSESVRSSAETALQRIRQ